MHQPAENPEFPETAPFFALFARFWRLQGYRSDNFSKSRFFVRCSREKKRTFFFAQFVRTQGSGKKRATGRENEASARRRRAAGAPKARRRRAGSAVTPPKKNTFFGPIFRIFPDSDMAPPPRGPLAGRFGGGVATGNDGPDFFCDCSSIFIFR